MTALANYYPNIDKKRLNVLEDLWQFAKTIEPEATEGLSYGYPALKLNGRPLIGFSVAKNHMTVYPFSPKVISAIEAEIQDYEYSKGLIRFTEDKVISKNIIELLIDLRKKQLNE
jgi:uncharacterized protein YdhG (YjbR/CyaY superfamily)